mgnify:CR=1 FL=1
MKVCTAPEIVMVRRKEEGLPYPEWLISIAKLLGITPEQARMLLIGVASLIGLAILLSLLK